ncbi:hypothetical protein CSC14_1618 [Proteus mirabilis]|nr:hypothetical protein CSC14_1618 [Proteus mirabilis]
MAGLYKYTLPDQHILALTPSTPIGYRQKLAYYQKYHFR